ncbi:hypothetical protein F9802_10385 [Bacillus aerolatus]|uniref:Nuclear transport factor 2 family protein n=1 Tax=Bacillus aerolatus TaxID=2653354 RepID=A0A6I1FF07_9BACI|nr:hypothetical protein [Bacillus aerolatus]KAB7706597.1 hypothetical protein F9802_10385 [Bacillus aerolatus]
MKFRLIGLALLAAVLFAGCGDEEAKEEKKEKTDEIQTTEEAEQQPVTRPIEEADNIPPKEKEELMKTLTRHVDAFNGKDLDAYMDTISKNTDRDYEEERLYVKKVFDTFDAKMEPLHTAIIKYDDKKKEAHIFVAMKSVTKDLQSEKEIEETTRQIMVFNKEEGGWKQTALSAMK